MQGAQILFYPTAIGWHPSEKKQHGAKQHGAWELIQRSHAVANGCYVAAVNRIGHEVTPASAATASSSGARASSPARPAKFSPRPASNQEEILIVPVDLAQVDKTRTHWPFLRDRRIDAYGGLTKRLLD